VSGSQTLIVNILYFPFRIPNPQPVGPKFAFKSEKPIRKKEERKKLPGWDCPTCRNVHYFISVASNSNILFYGMTVCKIIIYHFVNTFQYYEAMASEMEPGELEKLRNKCSKHRSKLPEPDLLGNTPRCKMSLTLQYKDHSVSTISRHYLKLLLFIDYWDLDFPSTEECLQNGLIRIGERSQRN